MTDEEYDEIQFNDLNDSDRIDDELWEKDQEYEVTQRLEYSYKEAYKDDSVKIGGSAEDMCYYIETNKYSLAWYVSPCDTLRIFYGDKHCDIKIKFDMSLFCELEKSDAMPGELIIKSANGDSINSKIDMMRVFQ
jgi:hypothetical protein